MKKGVSTARCYPSAYISLGVSQLVVFILVGSIFLYYILTTNNISHKTHRQKSRQSSGIRSTITQKERKKHCQQTQDIMDGIGIISTGDEDVVAV